MKLPYLGAYNPMLTQLRQRLDTTHQTCPRLASPGATAASSRFQLAKAVPQVLKGDAWQIRPLQVANAALTYEAYLTNPDAPIHRAGSCHAVEAYSWGDHLRRVEEVEQEHRTHKRFSFAVLDAAETKCLGCVHLALLRPFLIRYNAPNHLLATAGENAAMVNYWMCQPYRESHLPEQLVHALHHWLTADWELADHFFPVSEADTGSLHTLAAVGLQPRFSLDVAAMPGRYAFYGT